MSSTRYAAAGTPLDQSRFMSSPEYAELRGISGTAVTAKAAIQTCQSKRKLLFFIEGKSHEHGGLTQFAQEVLDAFPERIGTPTMRRSGAKKVYTPNACFRIRISRL
jgi:hypothetical protein